MLLFDLPCDILLEIWDILGPKSDHRARNALVQTCRFAYDNFNPHLYRGTIQATAPTVHVLRWAAKRRQLHTIHKLLDAGLDPINDASMAVLEAASLGHRDVVQALLWHNFDPNEKDQYDSAPIHHAVKHGHVEIVKDLLDAGADIDATGYGSRTPFETAVLEDHANVVSLLLERGVSPDVLIDTLEASSAWPSRYGTSLAWAARCGNEEVMKILLDAGANIDAVLTDNGETALHWAVKAGQANAMALLIDRGAVPNMPDQDGRTPLHAASIFRYGSGFTAAIKPLMEKGTDPSIKDKNGWTPLALAAKAGYAASVLALLDMDADIRKGYIDIPDERGRTPLFLATLFGHEHIVRILLAKGSLARRRQTYAGRTPLTFLYDRRERSETFRSIWELLAWPYRPAIDTLAVKTASNLALYSSGSVERKCYHCGIDLSVFDIHIGCDTCHNGRFTICKECLEHGYTCLDPTHVLKKWKWQERRWASVFNELVGQLR